MTTHELRAEVTALLGRAQARYQDSSHAAVLAAARTRLDEPLRVAIAGRVKAGKSTLLNALVGELLAPTDAGECTRIVTWYQNGLTYRVEREDQDGTRTQLPFRRQDGRLDVSLEGADPATITRLVVSWPANTLRTQSLIDTPGIGSLSTDVSARTTAFLTPDDQPGEADAVCYLMRHLHSTDVRFLEGFHDDEAAHATPMNAIAVLSRADEIGVGRIDAMQTAQRIAQRYRQDPQVRTLCQTVLPVAGLLAQAGATLRHDEFEALRTLAGADREVVHDLLLSADRFAEADTDVGVTPEVRAALIDRVGLFGVRLGTALLRTGVVQTSGALAAAYGEHSGIVALREVLASQFAARAELLKARSALATVDTVLRSQPGPGTDELAGELERIIASTHAFVEARLLNALRAGNLDLAERDQEEAQRLLGGDGAAVHARLGLDADISPAQAREAAITALSRWQQRAEHPLNTPARADAARQVMRSCEGVLAELAAQPPPPTPSAGS